MSAITLIVFGLIGFWVYWSVKHEGIFWIPKAIVAIGGFSLWITQMFKYLQKFQGNWPLQLIAIIFVSVILLTTSNFLLDKIQKKIDERVGNDPYKTKKLSFEEAAKKINEDLKLIEKVENDIDDLSKNKDD